MKHLKTFENITHDIHQLSYDDIGIKKYFILPYIAPGELYNSKPTLYTLYEIKIVHSEKHFRALQLYKYYTIVNAIKKTDQNVDMSFFNVDKVKQKIFYQSDNIQDCLDMLESIISSKKYNL